MRRHLVTLLSALLLSSVALSPALGHHKPGHGGGLAVGGGGNGGGIFDEEFECGEAVPAAVEAPVPVDSVTLDLVVLMDGVSSDKAKNAVDTMARSSYEGLKVNVAASYQQVSFDTTDAEKLIQKAKDKFGGKRPTGSDVVYVLTDRDIHFRGNKFVVGLADCIGGVRFPHRAFAVGEVKESISIEKLTKNGNGTAKIAGHEIGHLLGAHHYYANCVEGLGTDEVLQREHSPCTLMVNLVNLASLNFSTFNGAVVRGHASEYARP